jgi:hypothetical protein
MTHGSNGWVPPSGKLDWKEVSPAHPCPKCSHTGWCSVDGAGDWCCCRHLNDGTGKEKTDRSDGKGIDDLLAAGKVPEVVTGEAVLPDWEGGDL